MAQPTGGAPAVHVRPASPSDAPDFARLSAQLGYPAQAEVLAQRLSSLAEAGPRESQRAVLVVEVDGTAVGWIEVHALQTLTSSPRGWIAGLVVDEARRGGGLGRRLVESAEGWCRSRGLDAVEVRAQTSREGAHAFYRRLGFASKKSQHVFRRELPRTSRL